MFVLTTFLGEVSESLPSQPAMDQTLSTSHPKPDTQEAPAEPVSALSKLQIVVTS